jgi:hypothetical protein
MALNHLILSRAPQVKLCHASSSRELLPNLWECHQKFKLLSSLNNIVPPILAIIYRGCAVVITRPSLFLYALERVPRSLPISTFCK